jgi:hypothetical protein
MAGVRRNDSFAAAVIPHGEQFRDEVRDIRRSLGGSARPTLKFGATVNP